MAISLLDSGVSAAFTGSSATVDVDVTAGAGNRKLIIGIAMESAVTVDELDFNGQDLVALGLEIPLTGIVTDGVSSCIMFEQFEGGLPASGTHTITATLSGAATGGGRMFFWLVDGARQDQLGEGGSGGLANGGASVATFQTDETFVAGADDRACFGVAYRNDNATSLLLTTPSSSTNVGDFTLAGGGRSSGSHKIGSMGTGTVRPTWTTQATGASRRTGSAVMLNSAPDTRTISGGLTLGAVTVSGDVDHEPATVSGGFSTGVVGVSGDASHEPAEVSGGFTLGAVQITGTVQGNTEATVSGGLVTPSVTVDATATIIGRSRVGGPTLTMPGVDADGALSNLANVAGAVQLGAVTVTGTVAHAPANISGGIVLGAVQVGGGLLTQFPGSCVLLDFPAGSVELFDELAGAATLQDEPTGSVTLEFVE